MNTKYLLAWIDEGNLCKSIKIEEVVGELDTIHITLKKEGQRNVEFHKSKISLVVLKKMLREYWVAPKDARYKKQKEI